MHSSIAPLRLLYRTFLSANVTPIAFHPAHLNEPTNSRSAPSFNPLATALTFPPPTRLAPALRRSAPPHMSHHIFDKLYNTYSKVQDALTFNAATLSGAIDIVVVQHDDGLLTSTPFHVRFGKLQLLKSREKLVTIKVNGVECEFRMKLGHAGEAFFVFDADLQQPATEEELASPITSPILAPAAVLTNHGTITAINPIVNSGNKQHSDGSTGTATRRSQQEESKMPDVDLSHNTLSPPPRRATTGRLGTPPSRINTLSPTSAASSHHIRYSSSPPVATDHRRLADDSEERVAANSEHETRQQVEADTNKLADRQLRFGEEEAEVEEKASLRSHSAPMSPRTPEPTMRMADDDSHVLPPFPRLRGTLSMDAALLSPHSPLTPTSPSSPPDSARMMSAPSAADARDHTWQWTWGTLPVHHQRNKTMNDAARSEQIIHTTPVVSSVSITLRGGSVGPPSPMKALPIAASSVSTLPASAQPSDHPTATAEPTQPSVTTTSPIMDSAPAGWSMRGIFSTVLSKLPYGGGGGSTADNAPVQAAARETDDSLDDSEETDETDRLQEEESVSAAQGTLSPTTRPPAATPSVDSAASVSASDGSINLAEAHLSLPWLTNANSGNTVAPLARSNKPTELRAPVFNGSQALTSPVSAPLPSMPALVAATSSSSPLSPVSSDGLTSFSFALPPRAQASNAVERPSLLVDTEGHDQSTTLQIAVNQPSIGDGADTATTISPAQASLPSSTLSSPTSTLTDPLSTPLGSFATGEPSSLRLSLCGSFLGSSASLNQQLFDQHAVSFETLSQQPELTFRSDLVILYQSKLYPSRVALPLILSTLAFARPLAITQVALDRLNTMAMPHLPLNGPDGEGDAVAANSSDSRVENVVVNSPESGGRSWRDWFRSKKPPPIDTIGDSSRTVLAAAQAAATAEPPQEEQKQPAMRQSKSMEDLSKLTEEITDANNADIDNTSTSITIQSPNLSFTPAALPSLDPLAATTAPSSAAGSPKAARSSSKPRFIKSLRPTSDMLRSLNLQSGRNVVSFSVSSALQGEQTVRASIFLWRPDVKIVISDIDGTITRSDVLGHLLPAFGRDWSHLGSVHSLSASHQPCALLTTHSLPLLCSLASLLAFRCDTAV